MPDLLLDKQRIVAGLDQVGKLGGNDPGLAGAGAGNDQARPVEVADRLGL